MLRLSSIRKAFGDVPVLRDISLELPPMHTMSILGKSGGGKTTLLKIIAGLLTPDDGQIFWNGLPQNEVPLSDRGMVYIYQEPILFDHMTVFENIAYGLRIRKMDRTEIQEKVVQMLDDLGLSSHAQKRPSELSGGQRQRVSFGRAVIFGPKVLLLDEPFGNLDPMTRERMQELYRQIVQKYQMAAIFVTHDVKEALLLGDDFGLLEYGELSYYPTKEAFSKDPRTGVAREQEFWQQFK